MSPHLHAAFPDHGPVDPEALGPDPRAWARELSTRFVGRTTPDETVLFGWFAEAMRVAADSAVARRAAADDLPPPDNHGEPT